MTQRDSWKGRKVLVTGAGGFIGSWVAEKLAEGGASVRAFVRSEEKNERLSGIKGLEFFAGDLENMDSARNAARGCDAIFHIAALKRNMAFHEAHPALVLSANIQMTLNVLGAAKEEKVQRVILLGSARADDAWLSSPHFGYAWSKKIGEVLAEAYTREYGMSITSVRVENTFGPRDLFDKELAQVVPALIARVIGGENPLRVSGNPNEERNFSYIEDVAKELLAIGADAESPAVVAVSPSYILSFGEMVREIAKASGAPASPEFPDAPTAAIKSAVQETPNAVPARAVTPSLPLPEALAKTVHWYRESL